MIIKYKCFKKVSLPIFFVIDYKQHIFNEQSIVRLCQNVYIYGYSACRTINVIKNHRNGSVLDIGSNNSK
jgi:hypothetical protein